MPRHKKPHHLALLDGSAKTNPARYAKQDRQHPEPLAEPPIYLSEAERTVYREIEATALPGLLQRSDSVCVELAAGLLCQYRDDPTGFPASKLTLLRGFFRDLGLTPDGRQRFGIEPESDTGNEFDTF